MNFSKELVGAYLKHHNWPNLSLGESSELFEVYLNGDKVYYRYCDSPKYLHDIELLDLIGFIFCKNSGYLEE